MREETVSADDPRLADYRGVSEPELVRSRGLFIAEGRIVVARLIEDGRWKIRSVLVSAAARRDLESVIGAIAPGVPIFTCEAADFLDITGHDMHRGCLALVERGPRLDLETAISDLGEAPESALVIVLEGVGNADNVGGVFRNAAAFGADLIVLSPSCCSPLYRKAIRTSMGATLRVRFVEIGEGWPGTLTALRAAGFTLVALTPRGPSETLDEFAARRRPSRVALIVGAEGPGLTAAVEDSADLRVRIPILPSVDSLNLAVATGIVLERLTRGGRGRGILGAPKRLPAQIT